MAPDLLEFDHHIRHILILNFLSSSFMGDGPVLAKETAEVAVGEEDGARPIFADQGFLFAEMGVIAINHGSDRSLAEPPFALFPIHPALAGAEPAMLEDAVGLLDPLTEFSLFLQFLISWLPLVSPFLSGLKGSGREKQRASQKERPSDKIPSPDLHSRPSITQ
jgi:hypothetical protein